MRFLHPGLLNWGYMVLAVAALYLFRPRPRKVRVSSLLFFKSLAREHQESAWLRRLKRLLSFLLNVMIVGFAVLALAHPVVSPGAEAVRNLVIAVDRSASMSARDDRGRTRLEEALALARQRLARLPDGVGVAVVAFDRRPEILLSRTLDRREVLRALDAIRIRPIEDDAETALRLARRLAEIETPAAIWFLSDAPPPDLPAGGGETVSLEHLGNPLAGPVNAGLTAFRLRRLPLEHTRYEAFVQVHGTGPKAFDAELEVRLDDSLVAVRALTLTPGGRERLLIPVTAGQAKVITLSVATKEDALPFDNRLQARLPEARPVKVLWISENPDPFVELALASLGEESDITVFQGDPSAWPPKQPIDVVIFDGWLPGEWPDLIPAIVIDPPGPLGPVHAVRLEGRGLHVDSLRVANPRHPLLYGIATDRISVVQTGALEIDGSLEPLWLGPAGPLLLAGEVRGQRIAVMGFAPGRSERLPLMASCPLLFGNVVYWASEPRADVIAGRNLQTGDLAALEGRTLTWSTAGSRETETVELNGRFTELDRIGLWRTDADEAGSAALVSVRETLLPSRQAGESETAADIGVSPLFRGDLTTLFLAGILVLLVLESWIFHRHVVY